MDWIKAILWIGFFVALQGRAEIFGKTVKVVCLGNSVTYGYGLTDRENLSYPGQLQTLLGKGFEVGNFGHNGATLLKKGHNPYHLTAAFKEALAFRPDIALIHLGLNDTDPRNWPQHQVDFEPDYAWLIDTLRAVNPDIKIHLALLTPIFSGHPRFKSGTRDWHKEIRERMVRIAKANQVGLIDFHTPLHSRTDLFPDNLHPNAEGARILAEIVSEAITGDFGGLKMGSVFHNGAVLQRGETIPIFGKGNLKETVKIDLLGNCFSTEVDSQGNWEIDLPSITHGGPYTLKVSHGESKVVLENIWVGDVWLLMGQSNMEWPLFKANDGVNQVAQLPIKMFRYSPEDHFNDKVWDQSTLHKANTLDFFQGSWQGIESAGDFSAVGYFFAKKLIKELDVPIGLIQVAVGGAPIASFLSRESLEQDDLLMDMLSDWKNSDFIMPWVRERAKKNLENVYNTGHRHPYEPAYIHESVLSGLMPFAVKGLLWYQGESDTHNPSLYARMFGTMVSDFRKGWGKELPVYLVQLPGMSRPDWPYFREMQANLGNEIPGLAMAVTIDLGDSLDVHPRNKKEVGERLALLALSETYQLQGIRAHPPSLHQVRLLDGELEVEFKTDGWLQAKNSQTVNGFELVDSKGNRESIKGVISGNKVLLSLRQGKIPVALWYGFAPFPQTNLTDETGLAVGPFRYLIK